MHSRNVTQNPFVDLDQSWTKQGYSRRAAEKRTGVGQRAAPDHRRAGEGGVAARGVINETRPMGRIKQPGQP
jgi:hypothetical protein